MYVMRCIILQPFGSLSVRTVSSGHLRHPFNRKPFFLRGQIFTAFKSGPMQREFFNKRLCAVQMGVDSESSDSLISSAAVNGFLF